LISRARRSTRSSATTSRMLKLSSPFGRTTRSCSAVRGPSGDRGRRAFGHIPTRVGWSRSRRRGEAHWHAGFWISGLGRAREPSQAFARRPAPRLNYGSRDARIFWPGGRSPAMKGRSFS
jgi:hypothetical protein